MNVRGVLFILSVVSTMYRIGSKADLLRRQEEVDAGLGLDVTFTINKSMLCDSGRNWIKKQCSKQGRRIARNCRVRPNSMYISVSSFSVFFLLLLAGDIEVNPGPTTRTSSNNPSDTAQLVSSKILLDRFCKMAQKFKLSCSYFMLVSFSC